MKSLLFLVLSAALMRVEAAKTPHLHHYHHATLGRPPSRPSEDPCPSPFNLVGDQCLYIDLLSEESHSDGKLACQGFGGRLVAIRTATQLKHIIDYIREMGYQDKTFWIDGSDAVEEGSWVFSNGDPFPMGTPFWLASETLQQPDNFMGVQDCAEMKPTQSDFINDGMCANLHYSICEHSTTHRVQRGKEVGPLSRNTDCPVFFVDVAGICLALLTWQYVTWHEARESCIGISGELAFLDDIEQLRALYLYLHKEGIADHSFWAGGSDLAEEGSWTWINGGSVPMGSPWWGYHSNLTLDWEPEPDGGYAENCLALTAEGSYYFRDKECNLVMHPLCRHKP